MKHSTGKPVASAALEFMVGIIGGGVIGSVVAHGLLDSGFPASSVIISTRSPRRQRELASRGVSVFFDNKLAARRAHLLIIAVMPGQQLTTVAKSIEATEGTLIVSLVGGTSLAKIRSLFRTPYALVSAADTTLPRILQAQADNRGEVDGDEGLPIDRFGSSSILRPGRLPDEHVLTLAAAGFAPDARTVARTVEALSAVVTGIEKPAHEQDTCVKAVFGTLSEEALTEVSEEIDSLLDADAPSAPDNAPDAAPDAEDSLLVIRARAAFEARLKGALDEAAAHAEADEESDAESAYEEEAVGNPSSTNKLSFFDAARLL